MQRRGPSPGNEPVLVMPERETGKNRVQYSASVLLESDALCRRGKHRGLTFSSDKAAGLRGKASTYQSRKWGNGQRRYDLQKRFTRSASHTKRPVDSPTRDARQVDNWILSAANLKPPARAYRRLARTGQSFERLSIFFARCQRRAGPVMNYHRYARAVRS